jgi:hypothetical protein
VQFLCPCRVPRRAPAHTLFANTRAQEESRQVKQQLLLKPAKEKSQFAAVAENVVSRLHSICSSAPTPQHGVLTLHIHHCCCRGGPSMSCVSSSAPTRRTTLPQVGSSSWPASPYCVTQHSLHPASQFARCCVM